MGSDKTFHQLNRIDETEHSLGVKALAVIGFITLEKINKLLPYDDVEKIDEELKKYFQNVNEVLEEIKNS